MQGQLLSDKILELGATNARVIGKNEIAADRSFRDICATNACGLYGRCWACPPDIGDIDELMAELETFREAVLFQTISELEDSFDFEGMMEAGKNHTLLCFDVKKKLELPENAVVLGSGGCHLCETCTRPEGLPCRRPEDRTPGMETYGIDVYNTAKNAGLKYINGQDTVTYFGIVLY